jgi:hypothetical protein
LVINLNNEILALKAHWAAVCRNVLVDCRIPDVQERAEADNTAKSAGRQIFGYGGSD